MYESVSHGLTVRPAIVQDAETIFTFVSGLIDDHLPGQAPWTSAARIEADGFGPDPLFEALIAERDAKPVGFVSFFRGYAGWRGKPMGIVHALYVVPEERRTGAARVLMATVAKIAMERGWVRVELFVEDERPAIRFYEAIGMHDLHHRHMRLDGEALAQLAASVL
ncbi:GNAT superfamily N-acetyltransferase [Microvirga lupini]|uniref:GNAT superfamily N-acetyltransferase n=1 Tax=Microvirga lupini TaxID=420324 RepID=A0A7W4VN19_9HYPH|nr:GNAT family N-acetyltransferase [Microvirga lupini]MBB3020172.1 GNAT superfamily N-acetyltransferase [Microvirga lupini]